jgi:hypothetical protein
MSNDWKKSGTPVPETIKFYISINDNTNFYFISVADFCESLQYKMPTKKEDLDFIMGKHKKDITQFVIDKMEEEGNLRMGFEFPVE